MTNELIQLSKTEKFLKKENAGLIEAQKKLEAKVVVLEQENLMHKSATPSRMAGDGTSMVSYSVNESLPLNRPFLPRRENYLKSPTYNDVVNMMYDNSEHHSAVD